MVQERPIDVLRNLRIQEPFIALPDDSDFCRDLIINIRDWPPPAPDQPPEDVPVEGEDVGTPLSLWLYLNAMLGMIPVTEALSTSRYVSDSTSTLSHAAFGM